MVKLLLKQAHCVSKEMCLECFIYNTNAVAGEILPSTGCRWSQHLALYFWYLARRWRWVRKRSLTLPQSGRLRSVMFPAACRFTVIHSTSNFNLSPPPIVEHLIVGCRVAWADMVKKTAGTDPNSQWIISDIHIRGFRTTNDTTTQSN